MSNTQEFIYKGYFEGLGKHDKSVHIFKKAGGQEPYYMFKLDKNLEIGTRLAVNYNHSFAYRKGYFLVGGVCYE